MWYVCPSSSPQCTQSFTLIANPGTCSRCGTVLLPHIVSRRHSFGTLHKRESSPRLERRQSLGGIDALVRRDRVAPRTIFEAPKKVAFKDLPAKIAEWIMLWIQHVDDYQAERISPSGVVRRVGGTRIEDVFGVDALACLHVGAGNEVAARKLFLLELVKHFDALPGRPTHANHDIAIPLKTLIGHTAFGLYRAAIDEELHSKQFRTAVVLAGVENYSALKPTWSARKHFIIGGSSGAGKTYGAKTIIKALMQSSENDEKLKLAFPDNGDPQVEHFVCVDGGDARATSQIRKMVLQCALVLGYKGISDLHKQTGGLDFKNHIKNAAFHGSSHVHVVEPRTFADVTVETYDKVVRKVERVVFCMVETDSNVIKFQGESRAWYDYQQNDPKTWDYIALNNSRVGCESKAYSAGGLLVGSVLSNTARKSYVSAALKSEPVAVGVVLRNRSLVVNSKVDYTTPPDITISCTYKNPTKTFLGPRELTQNIVLAGFQPA